jgi:hypothetical protein
LNGCSDDGDELADHFENRIVDQNAVAGNLHSKELQVRSCRGSWRQGAALEVLAQRLSVHEIGFRF